MRFFLLLILFPFNLFSQSNFERLENYLDSISQSNFNGSVLYSRNDSILFKHCYGFADFELKTKLNDSSLFDLASVSKQFTAVAIIQLVEAGKIHYTTKVSQIINGFPYPKITIEHLLRHQSGLVDYMELLNRKWDKSKIATNDDLVDVFNKYHPKLIFEPGTEYQYSNTGYALLASIVEEATNESFGDYITNNIFIPCKMTRSSIVRIKLDNEAIANITKGYSTSKKSKTYINSYINDKTGHLYWLNGIVGDRMVYSTILDLEKWKIAFRKNLVISEESKRKMFSIDDISTSYGLGVNVITNKKYGAMIYHSGSWAGYKNIAVYFPDSNEYYVVLSNNSFNGLEALINSFFMFTH